MEVAKNSNTPPWTKKNLKVVLKQLKKNKSCNPYGLANEIFKTEVAGDDFKKAIIILMNRIK